MSETKPICTKCWRAHYPFEGACQLDGAHKPAPTTAEVWPSSWCPPRHQQLVAPYGVEREVRIMQSTVEKAEGSARSADRMGDNDVISITLAKELIEEAYWSGVLTERGWFQRGNGLWSHEKDGLSHRTIADAVKINF